MRIGSDRLKGIFHGRPVFIVGSGPSMRFFDVRFLGNLGVPTIALNQAWKYWRGREDNPTLGITVHPELVEEYNLYTNIADHRTSVKLDWAVKKKPPMDRLELDDKRYYVFHTSPDFATIVDRPADTLFIGRGVQQTAMDLAARCGASLIVLVGCDMTDLGGAHHGHDQHVQFHGLSPRETYAEYRAWTRKARDLIARHFQIPVLTLSPFVGIDDAEEDYAHLHHLHKLEPLPEPRDVSTYNRKGTDKP